MIQDVTMRRLLMLAAPIVLLVSGAFSQRVRLEADYAVFNRGKDSTYIELSFVVPQNALTYKFDQDAKTFIGSGLMALRIHTAGGKVAESRAWRIESHVADTTAVHSTNSVLDELRLDLPPGGYTADLFFRGASEVSRPDSVRFTIQVPLPDTLSLHWSTIKLCSSIRQIEPGVKAEFPRGGFDMRPNPGAIYTRETPVLYYYAELYNVMGNMPGESFNVRSSVENFKGMPVSSVRLKEIKRTKRVNSSAEVGTVNILSLPTGVYALRLDILDSLKNVVATARKRFYVFNALLPASDESGLVSSADVLKSEFATLGEGDLDLEFAEAKYIATQDEKNGFSEISGAVPKREFLMTFWGRHNPDPTKPPSVFRNDYLARVQYANAHYQRMGLEGWKTDRGRILLQYGKPQDIERTPSSEMKPYETWKYEATQGGSQVQFIFGDVSGFGDYQLLTSTARGEVRDDDWQGRLR